MRLVFNYLGLIGTWLSAGLIVPALVSFAHDEFDNGLKLIVYMVLCGFLSLIVWMACRSKAAELSRINSVYLAVTAWILFPFVFAIPIADLHNLSFIDALFESTSALTTTAADGIGIFGVNSKGLTYLRPVLQWFGGFAALLTFVILLGPIRIGGMARPRSSMGEGAARRSAGINRGVLGLIRYFAAATLLCFTLLMMCGVDAFSSGILAMTAVTAGGYIIPGQTLDEIAPPLALIVLAIFLIVAATSIFWHRMIALWQLNNLQRHRESYFVIGAFLTLAVLFFIVIANVSGISAGQTILDTTSEAMFNSASIISTSGLQTRPGIFALLPPSLILILLLIGGGSLSMAGGIKYFRLGGMWFHSSKELTKLIFPNAISPSNFGSEVYDRDDMKAIWSFFVLALLFVIISANALALSGMNFQASFTAAIAAFTNAGPVYSSDWVSAGTAGWPAYKDMNHTQKLILSLTMIFGRLEIIAILASINVGYWLKQ